jgi:hypothetical protein
MGSSAAWKHRIALDDLVSTLEHELHAAEASEGFPGQGGSIREMTGRGGGPLHAGRHPAGNDLTPSMPDRPFGGCCQQDSPISKAPQQ